MLSSRSQYANGDRPYSMGIQLSLDFEPPSCQNCKHFALSEYQTDGYCDVFTQLIYRFRPICESHEKRNQAV